MTARPDDLVRAAHDLMDRTGAGPAGVWPRAAALLGRRALEEALDLLWIGRVPGMEAASTRAQLIALRWYVSDPALAADVAYAWAALSRACHHHPYELGPTAAELGAHLRAAERLLDHLAGASRPRAA